MHLTETHVPETDPSKSASLIEFKLLSNERVACYIFNQILAMKWGIKAR